MRFLIGYAGIPACIYDSVYSEKKRLVGENGEFVGRSLTQVSGMYRYRDTDVKFFQKSFWERLANDHHNQLRNTCFGLVCLNHCSENQLWFSGQFFPAIFTVNVDWQYEATSKQRENASKNQLIELLHEATVSLKRALYPLADELRSRDNRTPLLLPIKNFSSNHLPGELQNIQPYLSAAEDKASALEAAIIRLEALHPRRKIGNKPRAVYVDSQGIEFTPPGGNRHGFARPNADHPHFCFISGRRRLGAPYDHAFHYDCTRGSKPLSAQLYGCHEHRSHHVGKPHLNIAPNDHVRGG